MPDKRKLVNLNTQVIKKSHRNHTLVHKMEVIYQIEDDVCWAMILAP